MRTERVLGTLCLDFIVSRLRGTALMLASPRTEKPQTARTWQRNLEVQRISPCKLRDLRVSVLKLLGKDAPQDTENTEKLFLDRLLQPGGYRGH